VFVEPGAKANGNIAMFCWLNLTSALRRHAVLWWILFSQNLHAGQCTCTLRTTNSCFVVSRDTGFHTGTLWPSNSRDLNPVDYRVWTVECTGAVGK